MTQHPDPSRLPAWIETVYKAVAPQMIDHDGGVAFERVHELILRETSEELALESRDAEYAVDQLLNRGYFYEVDGEIFVTEPAELDQTDDQ